MTKDKKHNLIFLIIPIIFFVIILTTPAHSQDEDSEMGCCGQQLEGGMGIKWRTLTRKSCTDLGNSGGKEGGKYKPDFFAAREASSDGTHCIEQLNQPKQPSKIIPPTLKVSIPGFGKFSEIKCDNPNEKCKIPWLAEYIAALYKYSVSVIGILAAVVIMMGGIMWLTAGGNSEKISSAMSYIKGGIMGVVITLCSYALLFILNPNLTILTTVNIDYLKNKDLNSLQTEDTSEPVTDAEFQKNPNRDKIDMDSSKWVKVPDDKKGLGITTRGASLKSGQISIDGIKKAAECFRKLDPKNYIDVASASRDKKTQQGLWVDNCCSGKCACDPPTCNPNKGNCPHTSGVAFDAWACNDKGCKAKSLQYKLQNCFFEAGFCLLKSECWHFEDPQFSGSCSQKNHYTGKYCTKPNE